MKKDQSEGCFENSVAGQEWKAGSGEEALGNNLGEK